MPVVHILLMKLASYITANGLTDTTFAKLIGRTQSTVSRIRRGVAMPDHETALAVYQATNGAVSPNDFFDLPSPPNGNSARDEAA